MKQLLILSGKGGTGKTTVASAFIKLSNAKKYADCDVDAPNLHLLLGRDTQPERSDFFGMPKANINPELCVRCDSCRQNCRFDAIDEEYKVDIFACEGCGVCTIACPADAVTLLPDIAGELMLYEDEAVFSTAKLKMGSGTSGKLVTEVKKQLKTVERYTELVIVDGSPGLGCPVIASLSGADMVLIVAEPSVSGISDMSRIIETAEIFRVKTAVCVNKYDTNIENSERIREFCREKSIPFVGKIPFDNKAVKAINSGLSIVDIDCPAGKAVKKVFDNFMDTIFGDKVKSYDNKNPC